MVNFIKNLGGKDMKKWIMLFLLIFLIAGVAYGKPYEVKKMTGT
jgi:hypothetical protein